MTLSESIVWSFARSAILASVALWPVAVLVRQIEGCVQWRARRIWLLLSVFPCFVPELLIGFNYRLTATQLSLGASPVVAATCTELLYSLLQISRCAAVGVAMSLLLPRSDVSWESIHLWTMLRTSLDSWRWWRGWLALRLTGPWQPMLISWCVMALITFQEFEAAALMQIDRHPVAWSVWLFDAHAARQPLADSLRMIVAPLTCEMILLSPALYLWLRRRGDASSAPDDALSGISAIQRSHRGTFVAVAVVSPGILLMLIWPICTNLRVTALGFVSILTQRSAVRESIQQILTSTLFAGAATFLAMTTVSRLYSGTGRNSGTGRMAARLESDSVTCAQDARILQPANKVSGFWQRAGRLLWVKGFQPLLGARWLLVLLLAPGLSGSLVMSVLLLALFHLPGVRMIYDTWLPMLLGQTLAVLPKALAVVFLLQKSTDRAAICSASLLLASSDFRTRRHASSILWRMKTSRWLLGGLVVAHWCFWDVTVASILRPVQLEPVVTRLYNEMHYGRTEALMSLSVLAAMTPLFVWVIAAVLIRLSRRLIRPVRED